MEMLESRRLFSTVVVNTALDQTDSAGSATVSLRDAITLASAATTATTVTFDPTVFAARQTISLAGGSALELTTGADVTLTGPAAGVVIDGNGISNDLIDQSGASASVNISNITFTNGRSNYGGGIEHTGSDNLTLTNVTVTGNTAYYDGGGIYNSGTLVIDASTISQNNANNVVGGFGAGGGIDNAGGSLTLFDSTVSGNTSQSPDSTGGGGIANIHNGSLTITDSTVSGNSTYANQAGGTLVNAPGGGVFSTGSLTITNSTISGNTGSLGGGMYLTNGVTLSDSTITGNTGTKGGGLYLTTDDTLQNSVVSGNTYFAGGIGPDVFTRGSDTVLSNGFNFIGESDGSAGWQPSDKIGTLANPLDADLGPLTDNGGPTQSQLPEPGSPLIDGGSNALIPAGITTDQRGENRIRNGTVDIGSVETESAISVTAPPAESAVVDQSQAFDLGSFTAAGVAAPFSVVVSWGEGSTNTTFTAATDGPIASQPHTYSAIGSETVTVTVTDASGDVTGSNSFTVEVGGESITVIPPADQTAIVGDAQSFAIGSFTQTDASAPYTVAVDWGDNSADTTFTVATAGALPAQSHAFTTAGDKTVTVNIADASGNVTSGGSFNVDVMAGSIAVTPPADQSAGVGATQSIQLGSFAASNVSGPFSVLVNWGDGSADSLFSTDAPGPLTAQLHDFAVSGTDTVTVSVTDASGLASAAATFTVIVTHVSTPSSVSLAISASAFSFAESETLTATVNPALATGTVTFLQNGTAIGSTAVSDGVVTLTSTAFSIGSDTLTANYSGDATYSPSTSAPVDITVAPPANSTMISLQISSGSIDASQAVVLTAVVLPDTTAGLASRLVATGAVTFYQGDVVLGTASVASGGIASFTTTSSLPVGSDSLTARYSGDIHFGPSRSPAVTIEVAQAQSTSTIQLSTASKTIAQEITYTAIVKPAGTTALAGLFPHGIVTFSANGAAFGTAVVDSSGTASLLSAAALPIGQNIITATYTGSTSFAASSSATAAMFVTPHALVPTINRAVVPAVVIAGQRIKASITTTLTNHLTAAGTETEKGIFTVQIFASLTSGFDLRVDPLIATVSRNSSIRRDKAVRLSIPISSLQASFTPGTYHLIVQSTDAAGDSEWTDTGAVVTVQAPVISLAVTFVSVPANAKTKGVVISLLNSGNVIDPSKFTAEIGLSGDPTCQNALASGLGKLAPAVVELHPGKAVKLRVTGWQSLFAAVPAGSYYLTLTIADAAGRSASATSSSPI